MELNALILMHRFSTKLGKSYLINKVRVAKNEFQIYEQQCGMYLGNGSVGDDNPLSLRPVVKMF